VPDLSQEATKPKPGEDGSWWTTLSGVLTGLAALLTAIGSLVVGLHQANLLPWLPDAPSTTSQEAPNRTSVPVPGTLSALPQVEGVGVKIVTVRRSRDRDRGATFLDLHYSVTTGSADFFQHDPIHFVQLILDGVAHMPVSASAPAKYLPSHSQQDVLVRFPLPPEAASIVFRFGEEHYLDLPARVAE
jgi:hypothetical protein